MLRRSAGLTVVGNDPRILGSAADGEGGRCAGISSRSYTARDDDLGYLIRVPKSLADGTRTLPSPVLAPAPGVTAVINVAHLSTSFQLRRVKLSRRRRSASSGRQNQLCNPTLIALVCQAAGPGGTQEQLDDGTLRTQLSVSSYADDVSQNENRFGYVTFMRHCRAESKLSVMLFVRASNGFQYSLMFPPALFISSFSASLLIIKSMNFEYISDFFSCKIRFFKVCNVPSISCVCKL